MSRCEMHSLILFSVFDSIYITSESLSLLYMFEFLLRQELSFCAYFSTACEVWQERNSLNKIRTIVKM